MISRQAILIPLVAASAFAVSTLAQQAPGIGKPKGPPLAAQPPKAAAPKTYGTDHSSFYRLGSSEFTPESVPGFDNYSDTVYSDDTTNRRYGTDFYGAFIATPHLPSGAKLLTMYVHGCSVGGSTLHGQVFSCNSYGANCAILAYYEAFAGCGVDTLDLGPLGIVVDNSPYGPQLRIELITTYADGSDSFAGVTLEYEIQVSPSPATPTFNDVPASDFGFQFIEALAASGITGGTGGGNFSPNANVTRRQMAIFLAKALGLQWR